MTSSPTIPIRWPAEAIWQAVAPMLPGFTVEVLAEVDSTNSELLRRLKGGAGAALPPEPLLLVAERQSAGRGRLGRRWQGARGASLMFSLGLPLLPADWSGLSLAVGVSVAESLDPAREGPHRIGLKWPNDLWLTPAGGQAERKLAGILVETASWEGLRYVVIGVGVNIEPLALAPAAETAPAMAAIAPGCLQELGSGIDAPQALLRIVPALVRAAQDFEQFGFAPFEARFAARDVLAGRPVVLSDGSEGTAQGVAGNGALRVLTPAGMREVSSAEVSVRPAAPSGPKDSLPC